MSGTLLELNFQNCCITNKTLLMKEAKVFGLTLLGDGATIKRMPLINVLAMSGQVPPTVLAINDCTDHIADGGKKDAPYIAQMFLELIKELDPNFELTDLLFFDGASNVQKAGELIMAKIKGAHCLHGGEHVISLFMSDISKLKQIKVCLCYALFHYMISYNLTTILSVLSD